MTGTIVLDPDLCARLAVTLAHFLWQGSAILLVLMIAYALLPHTSASARYCLSAAALLLMAACPLVTFLLAYRTAPAPATVPSFSTEPATASAASAHAPTGSVSVAPPGEAQPADKGATGAGVERASSSTSWRRYAPYLVAAYLVGAGAMVLRLLAGGHGGRRLRRRSEPPADAALLAAFARQAQRLGLAVAPTLALCRDVVIPTVVGVVRPVVLLPVSLLVNLTPAQIEAILAHELAHIRRYDPLVNVVQRAIEAYLFFHPAVWIVSRRMRIEREHCCDDMVLAGGRDPVEYADTLVRVAQLSTGWRSRPPQPAVAVPAVDGATASLRIRVHRLLLGRTPEHVRFGTRSAVLVAAVSLAGVLVVGLLTNQPAADASATRWKSDTPVTGGVPADETRSPSSMYGVAGRVCRPDGSPVAGATVVLVLAEHEARFENGRYDGQVHLLTGAPLANASTYTDADGRFAFEAERAVRAVVVQSGDGYADAYEPEVRRHKTLVLRPWARVEGRVAEAGRPASNVAVTAWRTWTTRWGVNGVDEPCGLLDYRVRHRYTVTTDAEGRYALDRTPPGRFQLWGRWGQGVYRVVAEVDVAPGEPVRADLRLPSG